VGADWRGGVAPGRDDDAILDAGGTYTVTASGALNYAESIQTTVGATLSSIRVPCCSTTAPAAAPTPVVDPAQAGQPVKSPSLAPLVSAMAALGAGSTGAAGAAFLEQRSPPPLLVATVRTALA